MLERRVKLFNNPWDHTIPNQRLYELLASVADSRATHVQKMHEAGEWPRDSLGLALMVPHASARLKAEAALLGTIAIGDEGERFVVNAIGKAFYAYERGLPAGYGVYVDLAASADGDFCYGFSSNVDGMIAAASGQKEIQDACEAAHAAATFLYFIRNARHEWFESRDERPHWFDDNDEPLSTFEDMADRPSIYP